MAVIHKYNNGAKRFLDNFVKAIDPDAWYRDAMPEFSNGGLGYSYAGSLTADEFCARAEELGLEYAYVQRNNYVYYEKLPTGYYACIEAWNDYDDYDEDGNLIPADERPCGYTVFFADDVPSKEDW